MSYNYTYEIAVAIIDTMMLFSLFARGMTTGYQNRVFIALVGTGTIVAFVNALFSFASGDALRLFLLCNFSYTLQAALLPASAIFITAITGRREYFGIKEKIGFSLPYIMYLVCIWVINPMTEVFFSVTLNGFEKGPLYMVTKLIMIYYFAISIGHIIKYRRNVRRSALISLSIAFPTTIIGAVIQWTNPQLLVMDLGICIAFLTYTMIVQRPEEILDVETGLNRLSVFMNDVKSTLLARKKVTLYLLKAENYSRMVTKLSVDDHVRFVRAIAKGMREVVSQNNKDVELYYLNNGIFAFWFTENCRSSLDIIEDTAVRTIQRYVEAESKDLATPSFYECVADIPEDIHDYTSIAPFLDSLDKIIPRVGRVYRLADFKGRDSLNVFMNVGVTLERALHKNELNVAFEPIYSTAKGKIVGTEITASLNDPRFGELDFETIMVSAERADLSHMLVEYIYERACRFISSANFKEAGLEFVTMRISSQPLKNQYLVEEFVKVASRYGVKPNNFILQIYGAIDESDWDEVVAQTRLLRFRGYNIALANFGGRSASIKRLTTFPVCQVKIDAELIRNVGLTIPLNATGNEEHEASSSEIMLCTFVEMLKKLSIETFASGVDDERIRKYLETLGCDYLQGRCVGRALLQNDFVKQVMQSNQQMGISEKEDSDLS